MLRRVTGDVFRKFGVGWKCHASRLISLASQQLPVVFICHCHRAAIDRLAAVWFAPPPDTSLSGSLTRYVCSTTISSGNTTVRRTYEWLYSYYLYVVSDRIASVPQGLSSPAEWATRFIRRQKKSCSIRTACDQLYLFDHCWGCGGVWVYGGRPWHIGRVDGTCVCCACLLVIWRHGSIVRRII